MRIVIAGGCRTGKTTLASTLTGRVLHTDDVVHLGWSESSDEVSTWFDAPFDVIEGVAAGRALRKWLKSHPDGKPCDRVIYLTKPHVELSRGQATMNKACSTVFDEIYVELKQRGVEIEVR